MHALWLKMFAFVSHSISRSSPCVVRALSAYHKAKELNNDDDASLCGHSDSFKVEFRIVFQDVKAMKEHKVDIKSVDNHWN